MRLVVIFYFIFGVALVAHGQPARLTVIIRNIKDATGKVGAALYAEQDFMKKPLQTRSAAAKPGEVRLVFENIPPGNYAISMLHDANDNGKMDTNLVGMPKEGFGFSNDALGTFGPPKFGKAMISCTGKEQTVLVTLKYY